jgi:geranylgeranyl reductase family protein
MDPTQIRSSSWQASFESVPARTWEVIVIGAGPAGSIAAAQLAAAGHRVLMVEKERFPRDKVCGDILLPDALRALERMSLLEEVQQSAFQPRVVSIFSPSRHTFDVPGWFYTLKRLHLDAMLARRAADRGAVVCHGRVQHVRTIQNGLVECTVAGANRPHRARMALIATGANVELAHKLGMVERRQASGVAARCYVQSSLDLDRLIFAYDRSTVPGYAWVFPLGNGQYNLGCGVLFRGEAAGRVNLRRTLGRFIASFPLAQELIRHGEFTSPLKGALVRCGLKGVCFSNDGNLLAIGETIGATYPFTGEGIGKALETGELAADVLHDALQSSGGSHLCRFQRRVEQELRPRYQSYELAERWLSRPWLNDFVMRRISKSDRLQSAFAGLVDESVDPSRVFSFRALLGSFWQ